jgi:D-alanyl-D-alanine carboxypeptidase
MYHYDRRRPEVARDAFAGLGLDVSVRDPRGGRSCVASERRIRPVVEPASELVTIEPRYSADGTPKQLHRAAYDAYRRLKAAAEADGIPSRVLTVTSGYRSVARQRELWAAGLARHGTPEETQKWVARPGGSPHHTGRAIDFAMGTRNDSANIPALRATPAYAWLVCNASRFGFTPYAREPWHWEFNPPSGAPPPAAGAPGSIGTTVSDTLVITRAIASGERDQERIASLVFYARHPERGGRRIARGETAAAAEWFDIRDRVVPRFLWAARPGNAPAAGPAPAPGPAAPPSRTPAQSSSDRVDIRVSTKDAGSLEPGIGTHGTVRFRPDTSEWRDIAIACTSAAEGGYDTVNMYDRGILSWGVMQWTVHAGSLQKALAFVKRRLGELGQSALWSRLFQGIDVRPAGSEWQLVYRGSPAVGIPALRMLFRGSPERGRYDDGTIRRWATIFTLAGRDPIIQRLQNEYARTEVDRVLDRNLSGLFGPAYRRIRDYAVDLKTKVLIFAMWTQNPTASYQHLKLAIDALGRRFGGLDPARWPPGWDTAMSAEFERVLRASRFAAWGEAKAREYTPPRKSRTSKILERFRELTGRA